MESNDYTLWHILDNDKAWLPGIAFTLLGDHSLLELDSRPWIQEPPKPSPSQSNQPGRLHLFIDLRW